MPLGFLLPPVPFFGHTARSAWSVPPPLPLRSTPYRSQNDFPRPVESVLSDQTMPETQIVPHCSRTLQGHLQYTPPQSLFHWFPQYVRCEAFSPDVPSTRQASSHDPENSHWQVSPGFPQYMQLLPDNSYESPFLSPKKGSGKRGCFIPPLPKPHKYTFYQSIQMSNIITP